jgi:hypothetical protein
MIEYMEREAALPQTICKHGTGQAMADDKNIMS